MWRFWRLRRRSRIFPAVSPGPGSDADEWWRRSGCGRIADGQQSHADGNTQQRRAIRAAALIQRWGRTVELNSLQRAVACMDWAI